MVCYGLNVPDQLSPYEVEVFCFFYDERASTIISPDVRYYTLEEKRRCVGRLDRLEHLWNIIDIVWNSGEDGVVVTRNEWLDRKLRAMIEYDWVSLAGCASSGKSYAAALYALVCFMCSPKDSLFLITSTSIEGARLRVWKTVNELWSKIPIKDELGEMVHSKCQIRGFTDNGDKSDSVGIKIVAAGSGSEQDAYDRLIGMKAGRLYLIADELPQLPKMINEAARGNLVNGSVLQPFKMISMGNPSLMTDAFGEISKPKDGWDSVTEADFEWETDRGVCIRFDAEQSPNMVAGEVLYPWLPKEDMINKAKKDFGERSLMYYRQYKAFWFKEAATETIYSESDIVTSDGNSAYEPKRDGHIVKQTAIAAGDPSFTQGGDVFPVLTGRVIETDSNKIILEVLKGYKLEDAIDDGVPRAYSMVSQIKKICDKHGISAANFGFDGTGAGVTFGDVISREWSTLPIDVQFGGSPSNLNAGVTDQRPAKEVYKNRVTELWVRGKGMLQEGMIRGIPQNVLDQMIKRRWNTRSRSSGGVKLMVESKVDMKAREGESPDWADAFFILLEVAIVNGLISSIKSAKVESRVNPVWNKMVMMHDVEAHSGISLEY